MPKTLYERDMEDSLRQIAVALGVDVSGTPDVEDVIRAAGKAGKDSERYRWLRDTDSAYTRPVVEALASNCVGWDYAIDAAMAAAPAVGAA